MALDNQPKDVHSLLGGFSKNRMLSPYDGIPSTWSLWQARTSIAINVPTVIKCSNRLGEEEFICRTLSVYRVYCSLALCGDVPQKGSYLACIEFEVSM